MAAQNEGRPADRPLGRCENIRKWGARFDVLDAGPRSLRLLGPKPWAAGPRSLGLLGPEGSLELGTMFPIAAGEPMSLGDVGILMSLHLAAPQADEPLF